MQPQKIAFLTPTLLPFHSVQCNTAASTQSNCRVHQSMLMTSNTSRAATPPSVPTVAEGLPANQAATEDGATFVPSFDFANPAFAEAVSGEWFGYEVSFSTRTGNALEIEERYVPDEYRNWDVSVTGFDSLTSTTIVDPTSLHVRRTRSLPTVGCEADAVIPEVQETTLPSRDATTHNAAFPDGSYSIGPSVLTDDLSQKWSFCLASPTTPRARARVDFGRVDEAVGKITVWLEAWDADYCRGEVLPGCGGPNSSFASEQRLSADQLEGSWRVSTLDCHAADQWAPHSNTGSVQRGRDAPLFALPRGLSVRIEQEHDNTIVEATWLTSPTERVILQRQYASDGELVSLSKAVELKVE